MKKRKDHIQGLINQGFELPVDAILMSGPMKSILSSSNFTFYIFESLVDKFDYESYGFVYDRASYVRADGTVT
ncbi:UNVERIFIED_CONTAM: hypothetical protein HDU68_002117, partial [Siphonaria sp. JEL0065]